MPFQFLNFLNYRGAPLKTNQALTIQGARHGDTAGEEEEALKPHDDTLAERT